MFRIGLGSCEALQRFILIDLLSEITTLNI